jgi:hypothetical protein
MSDVIDPICAVSDKAISSEPGRVVVVLGHGGYRTLLDDRGLTFGEKLFGGYTKFYLVDVSEHRIPLNFEAPSRSGTLKFKIDLWYHLAVKRDFAQIIVQNGVRSLQAVFSDDIHARLRRRLMEVDVTEINPARTMMQDELNSFAPNTDWYSYRPGVVTVELEGDVNQLIRVGETADLNIGANTAGDKVTDARVEKMMKLTDEELVARYAITNQSTYKDVLNFRLQSKQSNFDSRLLLLKMLKEKGLIEDFDIPKDLVPGLLDEMRKLTLPQIGSDPGSNIRGSLEAPKDAPNGGSPSVEK